MSVRYAEGLKPREEDIEPMLRGRTFRRILYVWADKAESTPFDFTGWTVTLSRPGLPTLGAGTGLTVSAGQVLVHVSKAQTEAVEAGNEHYTLDISEGEDEDLCLIRGSFPCEDP